MNAKVRWLGWGKDLKYKKPHLTTDVAISLKVFFFK